MKGHQVNDPIVYGSTWMMDKQSSCILSIDADTENAWNSEADIPMMIRMMIMMTVFFCHTITLVIKLCANKLKGKVRKAKERKGIVS